MADVNVSPEGGSSVEQRPGESPGGWVPHRSKVGQGKPCIILGQWFPIERQ